MDKYLQVKEFDSIIGRSDIEYISDNETINGTNYKCLPEKVFEDLCDFVRDFSNESSEESDAIDFMRFSVKKPVGDVITLKNYVGLIQLENGWQIEVLPKISLSDDNENRKTKQIFLNMLRSMRDFPSKVFNISDLMADRMNLYEIFINMYIQEVRQLVKHGLKSSYVGEEDNLSYFKGKLLINQHLKANIAHKERFYLAYDEYQLNRPENKLIKSTLLKLQHITSSATNSKAIGQLLNYFETINPSLNYPKDFSKVVIDRNTKDYEMLMKWSKVFLMNKSFTTFSGKNKARALLFPMEKVFESYVAQQIKKYFIPNGWFVSTQDSRYNLFSSPQMFGLRPDIVLRRGNRTIIMDTKWKNLNSDKRKNYGISREDMYQMYAYSKKYKTSEIWLLYPINDEMRNHIEIVFDAGESERNTVVRVFFIDLDPAKIEDSFNDLVTKIEQGPEETYEQQDIIL